MKILVIGNGGREHALVHTFARQGAKVYCLPGNPGTASLCEVPDLEDRDTSTSDIPQLKAFAKKYRINLTVVGPEAPLAQGIADAFEDEGLTIFGPRKAAACLETDKSFSKDFMARHNVPTADFETVENGKEALKKLPEFVEKWGGVALKASGLCAGKGVVLCHSEEAIPQVEAFIWENLMEEHGDTPWVLEQLLNGIEISLMTFCNGKKIFPLIPAQDHKALKDGDEGPNTGGMGAYAPAPLPYDLSMEDLNELILQPTLKGILDDHLDYRGVLYFGLMLTANGPYVLEYNCRMGDPEAQVVLPLMQSNLSQLMHACAQGLTPKPIEFKEELSSLCVVMAAEGYPTHPKKGAVLPSFDQALSQSATAIFQAGTQEKEKGVLTVNGGRVLAVTCWRASLEEAQQAAYQAVKTLNFEGAVYRKDIGQKGMQMAQ